MRRRGKPTAPIERLLRRGWRVVSPDDVCPDLDSYRDYIASSRSPARRLRITKALQAHDGASARREIEADIGEALSYVASLADETGMIAPARPVETPRRRRTSPSPAGALAFVQSERN